MKPRIIYPAFVFLSLLSIASCGKMPENGKLDGMWQMMSVNYARNSVYDSLVDMKGQKVYMAFQLGLVQITSSNPSSVIGTDIIIARFKRSGSELALYDFCSNPYYTQDVPLDDSYAAMLKGIGIDGLSADFHIDKLDGGTMRLTSACAQIIFRKF